MRKYWNTNIWTLTNTEKVKKGNGQRSSWDVTFLCPTHAWLHLKKLESVASFTSVLGLVLITCWPPSFSKYATKLQVVCISSVLWAIYLVKFPIWPKPTAITFNVHSCDISNVVVVYINVVSSIRRGREIMQLILKILSKRQNSWWNKFFRCKAVYMHERLFSTCMVDFIVVKFELSN